MQAVFLDAQGHVLEGPTMSVAMVTKDNILVYPTFDQTLAGITVQTVADLAPKVTQHSPISSNGYIMAGWSTSVCLIAALCYAW